MDLVRVCPECGCVCMLLTRLCSRCDADIYHVKPVDLRELVRERVNVDQSTGEDME